jgi:hypothetical protein
MFDKLLKHPDVEEITAALANGESVRSLEAKLKERYPDKKKFWITSVTLQKFRKKHLKLDGQVLKDIQDAGQAVKMELAEREKEEKIRSLDSYKNKINEIADTKLDVARKILQLDALIETRMEYWFNAISSGQAAPAKGDDELRKFMDRQMALLTQYKKFVEGMADKTIDHNINITVMNDQVVAIRDAIQECMLEFEPEVAMRFMEKLSARLDNLQFNRPNQVKIEELQNSDLKLLEEGLDNE